jgi:hypothetical protein
MIIQTYFVVFAHSTRAQIYRSYFWNKLYNNRSCYALTAQRWEIEISELQGAQSNYRKVS